MDDDGDALYQESVRDMRSQNPDTAAIVAKLRKAIDAGSPNAAYALATWYLYGRDDVVPQDYPEAVKLLELAAECHHRDALFDLAVCYTNGEGVEKDFRMGFDLYLQAALHGADVAVFKVGRAYYYGIGVAEDRRTADIWLDRAYELGTYEAEPNATEAPPDIKNDSPFD